MRTSRTIGPLGVADDVHGLLRGGNAVQQKHRPTEPSRLAPLAELNRTIA
jgi:hypothetical protein